MAIINLNEETNIRVTMASESSINAQLQDVNYIPGYQVAEEERRKNELERIANENERETYYEDIQQRAENGEFNGKEGHDGKSIEYNWNGTELGVRVEGEAEYDYTDLKGDSGIYIGEDEPEIEDIWIDTSGGLLAETDPTVPEHVKNITEEDIAKWNAGGGSGGGSGSDFSGSYNDLTDKPEIPNKTSQLENDSYFIQDENYTHTDNNYTDEERTKLSEVLTEEEIKLYVDESISTAIGGALNGSY